MELCSLYCFESGLLFSIVLLRFIFLGVLLCASMLSCFSHVPRFATPWTAASQAPLSIGFSRQEYGGGLPSPSPGDLPDPGIEPTSLTSPALASRFFPTSNT